ncbi:hypothetical protein MMC17_003990 [Xylographa soralifera]|nr:hypothetical protein [Xylographa soralifera]
MAQSHHCSYTGTILPDENLGKVIHRAARVGDCHFLEALIGQGRDLNGRDAYGNTPLNYATQIPLPRNVELLVRNGAMLHLSEDKENGNPLHTALINGYQDVFDIFMRETANKDNLVQAINSTDHQKTVLFIAASKSMLDASRRLLDAGAKIDCLPKREYTQITPLFGAYYSGHRQVVELLLSRGAQLEVPGTEYGTARKAAEDGGQDEILKVLDEWEQSGSSRFDLKPDSNAQAGSVRELEAHCEVLHTDSKGSQFPSGEIAASQQVAGSFDVSESDAVQITDLPEPLELVPPCYEGSAYGTTNTSESRL